MKVQYRIGGMTRGFRVASIGKAIGHMPRVRDVHVNVIHEEVLTPRAVLLPAAPRALIWLAGLSGRLPFWAGIVLIGLGLWSVWFGLFVTLRP